LNRRLRIWHGLAAAGLGLALVSCCSCDYSPPDRAVRVKGRTEQPNLPRVGPPGAGPGARGLSNRRSDEERKAILENSITLIQRAALQPGGENFAQAVRKLNQYFEGTDPAQYQLESAARAFLAAQLDPASINQLQSPEFRNPDTRHIEDCMMYYRIANRVAGTGDPLTRVRRVFDWVMRQVQLVPAGTFGSSRLGPAFARPYDVLVRGMASEQDGTGWAERAWLFVALCRQLEIDAGLITYSKGNTVDALLSQKSQATPRAAQRPRVVWICAVLVDDRAYLFDTRLGLEVPGPGGLGVATLEEALSDPSILERMNLPGLAPYSASRAALLSSPTKIGILIDSSPGYLSPKMRLLQRELAGKDRAILFSDPARQRDHFVHVLGPRAGTVALWEVPLQVEARLFSDPEYVRAIQDSLFWFQREFPLIYARVKQLRGEDDFQQAIEEYVTFRLAKNVPLVSEKKKASPKELQKTIPKDIQNGLDVYATYFLALAHLENDNIKSAEEMFRQVLAMAPEPQPGEKHPYYYMFRWGASTNLARIQEAKHDDQAAIDFYTRFDPTPQYTANLLRARELVWRKPLRPSRPSP
jgi:tetratricopeptide (TPR) repeat protein